MQLGVSGRFNRARALHDCPLFREILDSIGAVIETLEIEKIVTRGEDVPTQAERSAIERVQSTLEQSKAAIEVEPEVK